MTTSERDLTPDTSPVERQRVEIEDTRADMGRTLERIEDRVSPTRITQRQTDRLRGRWDRAKDRVMGSDPNQAGIADRMGDATDDAVDAVQDAPERLEHATRGNPIAAGLIAAGVGALAGSLLPSSEPERKLGTNLREEFEEPVRNELQHAAEQMGEELRDEAQHSAEEIKSTAQESAERTRQDAQDSARRLQDGAQAASQAGAAEPSAGRTPPSGGPPPGSTQPPGQPPRSTPPNAPSRPPF